MGRRAARAGRGAVGFLSAEAIDRVLHDERLEAGGVKRAYVAVLSSLPDGADGRARGRAAPGLEREAPALELLRLRSRSRAPPDTEVAVLTPRSIVLAIRAGFVPQVHESAGRR